MKVSIFRNQKNGAKSVVSMEFTDLMQRMGVEDAKGYVRRLRAVAEGLQSPTEWEYYDRIPQVCPTSIYGRKASGELFWKSYNGLSVLTIVGLNNQFELQQAKDYARMIPQTYCAMAGADGHSVYVWTLATLPDGTLPRTREQAELFCAQAYATSIQCYAPTSSLDFLVEEPSLDKSCPWTLDPEPYINPHPTPFILEQPVPETMKVLTQLGTPQNRLERMKPGPETYVTLTNIFNAVYRRVRDGISGWLPCDRPLDMVSLVADECARVGMPEEEVAWRLSRYFPKLRETEVQGTVNNIYSNYEETGHKAGLGKHQLVAFRLREFLQRRYEIRFNEILQMTEYRERHSLQFLFRELGRRELNTIHHEANIEGIEAAFSEVDELVHSSYVPVYNPIAQYLATLPEWDGKDRMGELARRVPNRNPYWERLFTRWFLSMVAHWMDGDMKQANATAPILIGRQGYRKSTFCRMLLPPELKLFFTDSIDFRSNIEAERCLSRFLLVNIDEFDQLSEKQFAFVKHLFQKPQTNIRRMYSEAIGTQRRYASFIGTSNHHEVLRDPTGNRRYICVEVTEPIDTETGIEYGQLYAQAVYLINHNERYWLNDEDEALLGKTNEVFEVENRHEQLFLTAFGIPESEEDEKGEWMRPTEILAVLSKLPAFNRKTDKRIELLGQALTHLRLRKIRRRDGYAYWVKRIEN